MLDRLWRVRVVSILFLSLALIALAASATAQPAGYYASVDTSSAAALRQTLHAVIDDHVRYPYTSSSTDTWDILESAAQDPNNPGRIIDVYLNASYAKQGGGVGNYLREPTWPKSFGFPNDTSSNEINGRVSSKGVQARRNAFQDPGYREQEYPRILLATFAG